MIGDRGDWMGLGFGSSASSQAIVGSSTQPPAAAMRSDVALDFAIFQLTPTRTRCELFVSTGNETEKIASGLLQPFLTHLKAAEEQIATGGYSIRLQPRPGFGDANSEDGPWFTKGTIERFVRFVSTPEILERVSIVSTELSQIEEDGNVQSHESSQAEVSGVRNSPATPPSANKVYSSITMEKPGTTPQSRRDSLDGGGTPEAPDSSKRRLLRAIDARRLMLQKEQGMAFARAAAAGFDMPHMSHLLVFADCFGATRLRDATVKFMALCKKRQDAGLWIEETELAAAEANIPRLIPVNLEGSFAKPKDQSAGDLWPPSDGWDSRLDDFRDDASIHSHRSLFVDGQGAIGGDGAGRGRSRPENLQRRRSAPPPVGQVGGNMRSPNRMEIESEYAPWGQAMDDIHDQDLAERLYPEDGLFPANGAVGSRWPPSLSPPPQRHPSNRYSGGYIGESGHESGAERGPHSRRSWGSNPSHSFPAQYGQSRGPHAHELDRDYHHDARNYHTLQNAPAGYYPNQIAYSDGNGGQGVWHQSPPVHPSDQSWRSGGGGYVDGPRFGHPGDQGPYRQQAETGSAGLAHMLSPTGRRENSMEGAAAGGGIAPSGAAADQVASDHDDSVSPPDEESHSPTSKTVRRSPSPKRRSPSPLRKLRPSGRRSSMVVIRNINYITSKQRENGDKILVEKESDGSESVDETDLAMDEDDAESKKSGSLSVKDAISLFEVKRSESNEDFKKRRSKQGSRRGSTDSTASSMSEKPVLRRWTTTGDLSRGSSTVSRSDLLDDNGDSQKVSAAESINNWPTQTEFSREAHALPKPTDAGDEALLLLSRKTQPSHTGFDPSSESAGPAPIQRENTTRDLGTSEEEVLTLPERSSKPSTRSSLHLGSENGSLLSRGVQGDDSFMIPDRFGQSDAITPRIVTHDMNELTQLEMPRISGDSFIVPARASRNEQSRAGWKSDLYFEAEMPEGQQTPPPKVSKASAPNEELFMMPERRDALNWSSAVDHSMENTVVDVSDHQKVVIAGNKPGVDSPKEHKGRLYEQYREKRDAKLRGELGSKKVERDAKLKAMQDVLEKRKAEMTARSGRTVDKHAPSVDAQLRAEKLRAFKADLARTKKEKDEEERKRLEEMRAQRRERIAARSSPSSGPPNSQSIATPRGSLRSSSTKPVPMQKLASPQKPAYGGTAGRGSNVTALSPVVPKATRLIQRKSSTVPNTPKNPLSRSVPSLAELRKENTRPSTLRSSIHDRSYLSKLAAGTIPPLVRASTAPLEANSMRPVRRAASVINDDKKRQSMGLRKSLPTLSLDPSKALEATSLKVSKTEHLNNKSAAGRRLSAPAAVTPEAKPFLRKGRGVVPGMGAVGARKSKESTPPADSIKPKQSPAKIIPAKQPQECLDASEIIRDTNGTHAVIGQISTSTIRLDSISCPPASLQVPLETKAPVICEVVCGGDEDEADNQDTGLDQASGSPYIVHIEDFASPSGTPTSTAPPHMDKFSQEHGIHHATVAEKLLQVQVDPSRPSPAKASTASWSGDDQNHLLESSETSIISPVCQQQQSEVHANPLQGFASLAHDSSPPLQSPPVSSSGLGVAAYDALVASNSNSSTSYKAPTAVTSVSPSASPVSESYPILQPSLSPDQAANANVGKSRKKWGSTEKVPSGAHILSKEEPKGLRKLLNFGRKSKNSGGSHTNDSVSASTTVENNGDAEVSSDTGSSKASKKAAELQQSNKGAHSTKSAKVTKASKSLKHASLIRESISKDVDIDDSVDERSAPARSFFSLSSFRSKGSEAKSRS